MGKTLIILLSSVLGLLLLGLGIMFTTPSVTSAQASQDHVPGQILVKFKDGTPQNIIDAQLKSQNAKVLDRIAALDVLVVSVSSSAENRVISALSANPNVDYAELNYIAQAVTAPNDFYFGNQWGLENTGQTINGVVGTSDADINAPTAWDTTLGVGVTAAILDTGINESHQDLVGKVVKEQDFTSSSSGTNDVYGHGTHVAGIVAANTNNSIGVAGVCPGCLLLNGKVLNDSGSGAYSWIVNGITWATDNHAKVINLSLGGPPSKTLENGVNYAWNHNVVVVAAAGNCGCQAKLYPAAYKNVIAVAATDNQDNKASFSSYSARWVDVAAPGAYIFSTWKAQTSSYDPQPICDDPTNSNSCYKFASGTSMATPMTSGTVALIWSTPSWGISASTVRSRLESTADKITGTGTWWSAGRIDAAAAVAP